MSTAALISWLVTASGGLLMLAIWLRRGGLRHQGEGGTRFQPTLIFGHASLASLGLLAWIGFIVGDSGALSWVAAASLVVVGGLGVAMFVKWLGGRASERADVQPEQAFPTMVVAAHGLAAVVTLVLVLVAAIQGT